MKKVYEAYDVFAATNEWPRDYIYYGLTPQQPKGPFNRDFKESLVYFKLLGDPRTVMNKICDQSEDPELMEILIKKQEVVVPEVVLFLHHGQRIT